MNNKRLYALTAVDASRASFYHKLFLAVLALALLFASLPVANASAAPAARQGTAETYKDLELQWSNQLRHLRVLGLFYDRVRLYPADFEDRDDLGRAYYFLHKYGTALRQANTVVFNHAGFDLKGRVTDEEQAFESVHDLAEYLRMMRGFREKLDEVRP